MRNGLNRREVLGLGLAGGAAWLLPRSTRAAERGAVGVEAAPGQRPKNVIFMVSDGMSNGVLTLAEPFAQLVRQQGTNWHRLCADPTRAHGAFETYSLNSLVTDSAAAATAWASGSRIFNGGLNMLPDGRRLEPIGRLYRQAGKRVGMVTTTQMCHATPAGFATVAKSRNDYRAIAPQYLDVVDVLMGGGIEQFRGGEDGDVVADYEAAGYAFWDQRAQVRSSATPRKVLGLFGEGHLPYTLDWRNNAEISERVPTLAEMTEKALAILADSPSGFLLQVEGGRIDHAAHANDAAGALWDQLAFDDAVGSALAFASARDDTLVIVTTDHGNANPGLNGQGGGYAATNQHFERLALATASFESMRASMRPLMSDGAIAPADLSDLIAAGTGITLSKAEAAAVAEAVAGEPGDEVFAQHRNVVGILGQVLGNHNGVGWTGVSHTADLGWLTATGPGSERFRGLLKNTDAFVILTDFADIDYRNPDLSAEHAAAYMARAPQEPLVEM